MDTLSSPSRLMLLPPELRNHIYGFVAEQRIVHFDGDKIRSSQTALFLVCRQVSHEYRAIHKYALQQAKHVNANVSAFQPLKAYLEALPPLEHDGNLSHRSVHVNMHSDWPDPHKFEGSQTWLDACTSEGPLAQFKRSYSFIITCSRHYSDVRGDFRLQANYKTETLQHPGENKAYIDEWERMTSTVEARLTNEKQTEEFQEAFRRITSYL